MNFDWDLELLKVVDGNDSSKAKEGKGRRRMTNWKGKQSKDDQIGQNGKIAH